MKKDGRYPGDVDKITSEFQCLDDSTDGEIVVGCAKFYRIYYLVQTIGQVQNRYMGCSILFTVLSLS